MRFILRADASPVIGTGHVMRLLAIAEELAQHGQEVIFLGSVSEVKWLENRIQNFGFSDNSNPSLISFMNDQNGHTITTPENLITNNTFIDQIYIEIPHDESGQVITDTMLNEFKVYLQLNGNPTSNVYGALLNLQLQPSVIVEITKLEPKSNEINTSRVTIV